MADGSWSSERRWALLRVVLGFLQVFGASLSLALLLQLGVTSVTLTAIVLTGLCTILSVLLFGGRRSGPGRGGGRQVPGDGAVVASFLRRSSG